MSLERYFARAHEEARRLLIDAPFLIGSSMHCPGRPRWRVAVRRDDERHATRIAETPEAAAREVLSWVGNPEPELLYVARVNPFGLYRVLDRAMVDIGGSPTLAAGEGVEARRLLEMVAWDKVPQARWPDVFDTLRMAAVWKSTGCASWLSALRSLLEEDEWLAEEAERSAA